ncbi:MAG: response regulator, partial [Pirellulaceae bacterium]
MPKQVLIIDDDPNIRKCLSLVLSEQGYEPVSACDGAEGLRKVRQAKPDLIILDVMMPNRSGLLLFRELKEMQAFKEIPILMLTGAREAIDELVSPKDETARELEASLGESLKKKIHELREGPVRPEIFLDKPVDPDA